jgi:hypothetical protein
VKCILFLCRLSLNLRQVAIPVNPTEETDVKATGGRRSQLNGDPRVSGRLSLEASVCFRKRISRQRAALYKLVGNRGILIGNAGPGNPGVMILGTKKPRRVNPGLVGLFVAVALVRAASG